MTYRHSLARIPTRRLLEMKNSAYRHHGGNSEILRHGTLSEEYGYGEDWANEIPIADIKTELTGREHVPNKKEAKALRREAAQGREHKSRNR